MSGSTVSGMASSTSSVRFALVTNIMTSAPISMMKLRNACESDDPAIALICVVSAVRRLINSPECVRSKNAGPRSATWRKTSRAQVGDDTLAQPVDVVEARGAGERRGRGR